MTGRGPAAGGHRCPVPPCTVQVGPDRLMCPPDWYRVPKPLRDVVWRTWDGGRGLLTPAYTAARRAAVDAARRAREAADQALSPGWQGPLTETNTEAWGGGRPSRSHADWLAEGEQR